MNTITGDNDDNTLTGTDDADLISGLDGSDQLHGGGGNDTLDGGAGSDWLLGDSGDDTLQGGAGDDGLQGGEGNDLLQGGDGNDYFYDFWGANLFDGGAGDDQFDLYGWNWTGTQTVTGGDGSDTYKCWGDSNNQAVLITDFAAGDNGDRLDVDDLLGVFTNYTEGNNPFADTQSYLRLTQSGSDTLLQWDRDGVGSGDTWHTVVTLQGIQTTDLTAANFTNHISPDGSAVVGLNWTGTDNNDNQTGTVADDQLQGLAGDDILSGSFGNDTLVGGDGLDNLTGGPGDDSLVGGTAGTNEDTDSNNLVGKNGNDTLIGAGFFDWMLGGSGDDSLSGLAGNDYLQGDSGNDTLLGGSGDDHLTDSYGVTGESNQLIGGDGFDVLDLSFYSYDGYRSATVGNNTLEGGTGDDQLFISNTYYVYGVTQSVGDNFVLDGGDGNDQFTINSNNPFDSSTVTGGTGVDTYHLSPGNTSTIAVTDFTGGIDGDVLDIETLLSNSTGYSSGNPLDPALGYLRVVQLQSGDTLLQWDNNGLTDGSHWRTVITLQGVQASTLTTANFSSSAVTEVLVVVNSHAPVLGTPANLTDGTEDTPYTIAAADLLQGWSDADSDSLSVVNLTANHGTVLDNSDGTYTLTPDSNYNGTVTLSYRVSDSTADVATTLGLTLTAVNDAPTLIDTAATLADGIDNAPYTLMATDLLTGWTDADGTTPSVTGLSADYGTVVDNNDGTYTLTPMLNYQGSVTLSYAVTDGTDSTDTTLSYNQTNFNTDDANLIIGLDGDDYLYGYGGNDTLDGGAGNDDLYGGSGDDSLQGGAGNDVFLGDDGNDLLDGGDGNDVLYGGSGNDSLQGGDGNDWFSDWEGANVFDGGAGDDSFNLYGWSWWTGAQTVMGGDGSDTYELSAVGWWRYGNHQTVLITDFAAGGDRLDVDRLLLGSTGYTSGNPFAAAQGYLRLTQSGSDALLQWDSDGVGSGDTWQTLVTLQGVQTSDLTAANFTNHISPDGLDVVGLNWTGTADGDDQTGTVADDQLQGLAANDLLFGGFGNDTLEGGDDYDQLIGGPGDDRLVGGTEGSNTDTNGNRLIGEEGNDTLVGADFENYGDYLQGGEGDDSLSGFAGDDSLWGSSGNDSLSGGTGNDSLHDEYGPPGENNQLIGGDGFDELHISFYDYYGYRSATVGNNTLQGGADDDQLFVENTYYVYGNTLPVGDNFVLDGGDGNDQFTINSNNPYDSSTITGGTGVDIYHLNPNNTSAITVTDFTGGTDGDVLDVETLLSNSTGYSSGNPLDPALGYLRVVQLQSGDTLLQWDNNGLTDGSQWRTLITLQNVQASTLTTANFSGSVTEVLVVNSHAPVLGTPATLTDGTEDTPYTIAAADLLQGWSDADSDSLSVVDLTTDHGTVLDNSDGTYTLTPDSNYNGTVTLSYRVSDSTADVATTLGLTLTPVNDAPALIGTAATLADGVDNANYTIAATDLLTGWTDVDGDTPSVTDLSADHGTVVDNSDGTYTLTPALNYQGSVTLSYMVTDGTDSAAATLSYQQSDVTPSTVAITLNDSMLKIGDSATVTFTFSEVPLNFSTDYIQVDNGQLYGLYQDWSADSTGKTYTATFAPSQDTEDPTNSIRVNSAVAVASGLREITSSSLEDHENINTAYAIQVNSRIGHYVINGQSLGDGSNAGTSGDIDWFKIHLTAGQTAQIKTDSWVQYGAATDTVLGLFDGQGNVLSENNDGNGNLNSLITYNATQSGDYYIAVRGVGAGVNWQTDPVNGSVGPGLGGAAGSYDLSISLLNAWTDSAGNLGVANTSDNYAIDTLAPEVTASIDAMTPITGPYTYGSGGVTNSLTQAFTGTLSGDLTPGDRVNVYDEYNNHTLLGEAMVTDGTHWSYESTLGQAGADETQFITAAVVDQAGNQGPLSSVYWAKIDNLAPTAPIIAANGNTLVLHYEHEQGLDDRSVPTSDQFAVTVQNAAVSVSDVAVRFNDIVLTLATPVVANNTVKVTYTGSDTNPIRDLAGNDTIVFNQQTVAVDTTAPTLQSFVVNSYGQSLMTFSEPLNSSADYSGNLSVMADGVPVDISYGMQGRDVWSFDSVYFYLPNTISPTADITISYTDPTPNNDATALEDLVGNDVASFTTHYSTPTTRLGTAEGETAPTVYSVMSSGAETLTLTDGVNKIIDAAGAQTYTVNSGAHLTLDGVSGENTVVVSGYQLQDIYLAQNGADVAVYHYDEQNVVFDQIAEIEASTTVQYLRFEDGYSSIQLDAHLELSGASPILLVGSLTLNTDLQAIVS